MAHRLQLDHIEQAARVIDPVFLHSPQYRAESLEEILGCSLVVKIECLNPIRSFKGRGASFFVSTLPDRNLLVCASAGNFGQAMAYACRAKGIPLIVFASTNANSLKIERMRTLGAEVRLVGEDFDAAKLYARHFAAEAGARFVEDSLEPATGEGAGTMAVELLRWPEPFDAVVVALGNGAMLAGVARWMKTHSPQTEIIGVCARGAPAMAESWRSGRIIEHPRIETIADGIGVRLPIPEAVADLASIVDDVLLVDDDALLAAMKLLHRHLGLVVEPSGAAGVAALHEFQERFQHQLVATIVGGGNLTPDQMRAWLA